MAEKQPTNKSLHHITTTTAEPPMHRFLAAISLLALASCSQVQTSDAVMCGAGLMAARAVNTADLLMTAQSIPACRALALDAMQGVVVETMAKRGLR